MSDIIQLDYRAVPDVEAPDRPPGFPQGLHGVTMRATAYGPDGPVTAGSLRQVADWLAKHNYRHVPGSQGAWRRV